MSLLEGADNTPAGRWGGTEEFKEMFPDGYIIALDNGTVKVRKDHKWIIVPIKDLNTVFMEEFGIEIPAWDTFEVDKAIEEEEKPLEVAYKRAMAILLG